MTQATAHHGEAELGVIPLHCKPSSGGCPPSLCLLFNSSHTFKTSLVAQSHTSKPAHCTLACFSSLHAPHSIASSECSLGRSPWHHQQGHLNFRQGDLAGCSGASSPRALWDIPCNKQRVRHLHLVKCLGGLAPRHPSLLFHSLQFHHASLLCRVFCLGGRRPIGERGLGTSKNLQNFKDPLPSRP